MPLIESPCLWENGEQVRTSYGIGTIRGFDPVLDLYDVELDWRPLDEQVKEHVEREAAKNENHDGDSRGTLRSLGSKITDRSPAILSTVVEEDESNCLSPVTSFDVSKHSSKQSLHGVEQTGLSNPLAVNEEKPSHFSPSANLDTKDDFSFDASAFDRKGDVSPQPTLDETTGTVSTLDEASTTKSTASTTVASPVPLSVTTKDNDTAKKNSLVNGKVFAKIQGRHIKKYTPPSLPKLQSEDKNRSKFSFWGGDSVGDRADAAKSKSLMSPGDKVATPYGEGIVVEHRQKTKIIVVDLIGWTSHTQAYLQESVVKREGSGFLGRVFRQLSSAGDRQGSPLKKSLANSAVEKQFPHATGTAMYTPFGEGIITRPLPVMRRSSSTNSLSSLTKPKADCNSGSTLAISITSWTLGDGCHPTLYCTVESAKEWKKKTERATPATHRRGNSLFSALGSLVTGTVESLKKIRVPREIEAPIIKIEDVKFERYYKDGAAVTTTYGDGTVRAFRESDGFYTVSLLMKSGKAFATAHLQEDSLSFRLAKGCIEGYPVLTKLGLSGVLQSVNPTTGVHHVIIPSCGIICYLQPDQVIRPLKSAVGEDVSTPYGEGKVTKYRLSDDIYEIRLSWGNTMLYAKAQTFDRIDDRMEDKGGFGMGWILQFFYSREESKHEGPGRSRSNSFSVLSQSGRSVKSHVT